jgi:hypothetical protein
MGGFHSLPTQFNRPPRHQPQGGFFMEIPMEGMRQLIGAVFVALADAGGDDVLRRACETLTTAVELDGVSDPYARCAIRALVRSCGQTDAAA